MKHRKYKGHLTKLRTVPTPPVHRPIFAFNLGFRAAIDEVTKGLLAFARVMGEWADEIRAEARAPIVAIETWENEGGRTWTVDRS